MASVRCLFFIFSSLMWVGAHVPPANGIEKATLHTKRKPPYPHGTGSPPHRSWIVRSRKTGSSPGSESSRGCVFPSLLSDRTLVHAALLFLTVAGPLRHRPDSLLSSMRSTCFLCSSHLYSHHLNLSSLVCQLKITENNSQISISRNDPARCLTKRMEYCKISIEKGLCRWAAAPTL